MPTVALANAISFHQMENPDAQFPKVRVWGTIGWIVAGLLITYIQFNFYQQVEASSVPMKIAAVASIILGFYAFTLPHTPPQKTGGRVTIGDILGLKALKLLKDRSFLIFVISSLLICIPLAFYYNFTNMYLNDLKMTGVAAKQSMGQMSEVIFMVLMPWFFVRLGVKKMLLIGMLAWILRYVLFASGDMGDLVWMLYLGIILHGVCYDFFFVTGQIYVNKKAGTEIRASAQGLFALVTYGLGIGIGSVLSGQIVDLFTVEGVKDWSSIWWVPAIFAAVVTVFFFFTFKDQKNQTEQV
jgi:nucleoside transporter